jgi:hypothetical protein
VGGEVRVARGRRADELVRQHHRGVGDVDAVVAEQEAEGEFGIAGGDFVQWVVGEERLGGLMKDDAARSSPDHGRRHCERVLISTCR